MTDTETAEKSTVELTEAELDNVQGAVKKNDILSYDPTIEDSVTGGVTLPEWPTRR